MINAIATQGHPNSDSFVSEYYLSSSDDSIYWRPVYTRNSTIKEAIFFHSKLAFSSFISFNSLNTNFIIDNNSFFLNFQLFQGNTDGNSVVINRFDPPIIAQFVRINPTRWRDRISLRLQLYGCDYRK